MQTIVVAVLAIAAVASAGVVSPVAYTAAAAPGTFYTRAPAFDSAVIKSDRLGGNFAYSVQEAHAYAAHTPVVQYQTSPVAVSYSAPAVAYNAPAVAAYNAPIAYNGGYGYGYGYPTFGYGYNAYPTYVKK